MNSQAPGPSSPLTHAVTMRYRGMLGVWIAMGVMTLGLLGLSAAFYMEARQDAQRAADARQARIDILTRAQVLEQQVRALGERPAVPVSPGGPPPQLIPGPVGPSGLPGLPGQRGERGQAGQAGQAGTDGEDGGPGADGEQGPPGEAGAQGEPGESITGPPGPAGPQGEPGPQGEQGRPPACAPNCAGPQGPQGPPGDRGPAGAQGVGIASLLCDSLTPITFTVTYTDGTQQTFTCGGSE